MAVLPDSVIGDGYDGRSLWALLEDLVDLGPRQAGTSAEAKGSDRIADVFETLGLGDIRQPTFEIPGWTRQGSHLRVPEATDQTFDQAHQLFALPNCTPGSSTGPLVDVGDGLPEDFEHVDCTDSIVLASSDTPASYERFIHRREKYRRAIDAGARGFIFASHVEGCLPPTGSVGSQWEYGPIPAVGASKELADRLRRYVTDGIDEVEFTVEAEQHDATSITTEGRLGPSSEQEVLVTAHIDSHDITEGARDNGVGCAIACEIARLLAPIEEQLETGVRFVVFGAEEIGLLGSEHWAREHNLDRVKGVVNVDGAGYSGTLHAKAYGYEGIERAATAAGEALGRKVHVDHRVRGHSDVWSFTKRGVPGMSGASYTPDRDRGWGHTHADTLDKLDAGDLRDLAIVLAETVVRLADADLELMSKSEAEVRKSIGPGEATEMQLLDRYP